MTSVVTFTTSTKVLEEPVRESTLFLRREEWDDFGFKTLFEATLLLPGNDPIVLGGVKIMRAGQQPRGGDGITKLPSDFDGLSTDFCSLGQDLDYYEKLYRIEEEVRFAILSGLQDVVANRWIVDEFQDEPAWEKSLLRFGTAEHALASGAQVLFGDRVSQRSSWGHARFGLRHSAGDFEVGFHYDANGPLPGRINVLIGYNGVGKTRLLAELGRVASGVGVTEDEYAGSTQFVLTGRDKTFGAVIAISYSAFDTFELPSVHAGREALGRAESVTFFGYTYCGLRRVDRNGIATDNELKSPDEIDGEFLDAMTIARYQLDEEIADARMRNEEPQNILGMALQILSQEPSFGRIGVNLADWIEDPTVAYNEIGSLSTGHKIVANIVVQLAARLQSRSLVLIDEPETHLHPPLLAALLRAIQFLLNEHDSFAIVATHSPVVLQEVPSSDVRMVRRFGDITTITDPMIETFGEGIGEITRHVFSLDSSATDYQGVIRHLAGRMTLDEFEDLFENGVSSQARTLFLRAKKEDR